MWALWGREDKDDIPYRVLHQAPSEDACKAWAGEHRRNHLLSNDRHLYLIYDPNGVLRSESIPTGSWRARWRKVGAS